ncbi:hypothetical protein [Pontibacter roseus]|uniref:hypothetical protein n=1 Tax=Pontibacter roseus TaxID=336989 RepID=UPI00035E1AF0|nr:hypothetical protein [Pontibacter roseus]
MEATNFISIEIGSGDARAVLAMDLNKLCFLTYKPETAAQTAKLVLDFGSSQKILEKKEAEQVYAELARHSSFRKAAASDF